MGSLNKNLAMAIKLLFLVRMDYDITFESWEIKLVLTEWNNILPLKSGRLN